MRVIVSFAFPIPTAACPPPPSPPSPFLLPRASWRLTRAVLKCRASRCQDGAPSRRKRTVVRVCPCGARGAGCMLAHSLLLPGLRVCEYVGGRGDGDQTAAARRRVTRTRVSPLPGAGGGFPWCRLHRDRLLPVCRSREYCDGWTNNLRWQWIPFSWLPGARWPISLSPFPSVCTRTPLLTPLPSPPAPHPPCMLCVWGNVPGIGRHVGRLLLSAA